ncbi:MAG TPA: hypothetical protein VNP92_22165 [Actinophytocola sp.]|nr:hypothetical protein [Actinophytocola sp.]
MTELAVDDVGASLKVGHGQVERSAWGEHAEAAVAALPLVDGLQVLKDVERHHQ